MTPESDFLSIFDELEERTVDGNGDTALVRARAEADRRLTAVLADVATLTTSS